MCYFRHCFSLLILIVLLPNQALSLSCPPCTAEHNDLQRARDQLRVALKELAVAEKKADDAKVALANAVADAEEALSNILRYCIIVRPLKCGKAMLDADRAASAILQMNAKYKEAVAELQLPKERTKEAEVIKNNAQTALSQCEARATPGICMKCSNGQVVNDDGTPCDDGDKCTASDMCEGGNCKGTPIHDASPDTPDSCP